MNDGRLEAATEALSDALDHAACGGDTRLHPANPIWNDRAAPPEDFDTWVEFAAHRVLTAVDSIVGAGPNDGTET